MILPPAFQVCLKPGYILQRSEQVNMNGGILGALIGGTVGAFKGIMAMWHSLISDAQTRLVKTFYCN